MILMKKLWVGSAYILRRVHSDGCWFSLHSHVTPSTENVGAQSLFCICLTDGHNFVTFREQLLDIYIALEKNLFGKFPYKMAVFKWGLYALIDLTRPRLHGSNQKKVGGFWKGAAYSCTSRDFEIAHCQTLKKCLYYTLTWGHIFTDSRSLEFACSILFPQQ